MGFFKTSFTIIVILLLFPVVVNAQTVGNNTYKAKIINEVAVQESGGNLSQELELKILSGKQKGTTITIVNNNRPNGTNDYYKEGDRVLLEQFDNNLVIQDYWRADYIIWLTVLFITIALAVLKFAGISTLISLLVSFLVIIKVLLPLILNGFNPVLASILTGVFLVPFNFYLTHGFSKKTTVSIISTLATMVVVVVLSIVFTNLAYITGVEQEGATYLQVFTGKQIDFRGLFLAGILIAAIGTLDDITISQASVVNEIKHANSSLGFKEVYTKSMNVGKDHIASLINTLFLVYTGAFLPLLLLFSLNQFSPMMVLNFEVVAAEIIRTLVGSIGLILAVPISTALACLLIVKPFQDSHSHTHFH